jgi:hypothetical protein
MPDAFPGVTISNCRVKTVSLKSLMGIVFGDVQAEGKAYRESKALPIDPVISTLIPLMFFIKDVT